MGDEWPHATTLLCCHKGARFICACALTLFAHHALQLPPAPVLVLVHVHAGAEGAVYAAWFLESPVAVKKFDSVEASLHEVEMYLQLGSHDNVVALRLAGGRARRLEGGLEGWWVGG